MAGNVLVESPNEAQIRLTSSSGILYRHLYACPGLHFSLWACPGAYGHERACGSGERASEWASYAVEAIQLCSVLQSKAKHMKVALPYSLDGLPFAH